MKIIIVILFAFISISSISANQRPQDPFGTYFYTLDEVYNELDIAEMENDSLSFQEIKTEVNKKNIFANVEIDIQIVQLWNGKFHTVKTSMFKIDEFDEHMFVRVKVK